MHKHIVRHVGCDWLVMQIWWGMWLLCQAYVSSVKKVRSQGRLSCRVVDCDLTYMSLVVLSGFADQGWISCWLFLLLHPTYEISHGPRCNLSIQARELLLVKREAQCKHWPRYLRYVSHTNNVVPLYCKSCILTKVVAICLWEVCIAYSYDTGVSTDYKKLRISVCLHYLVF